MRDSDALLRAARKLDKEALNAIFDQFAPAIYKYVLRLTHDPTVADDIVGDVFVQLLEQFGAGKGPRSNLRTYLYQTAFHLATKYSRGDQYSTQAKKTISFATKDRPISIEPTTEEQVMMEALISALNTELTEDQRHIIILRFLEDFSLKETAEIIGKEVNQIKVTLRNVKEILGSHPELLPESLVAHLGLPGDSTTDAPPPKKKKKK